MRNKIGVKHRRAILANALPGQLEALKDTITDYGQRLAKGERLPGLAEHVLDLWEGEDMPAELFDALDDIEEQLTQQPNTGVKSMPQATSKYPNPKLPDVETAKEFGRVSMYVDEYFAAKQTYFQQQVRLADFVASRLQDDRGRGIETLSAELVKALDAQENIFRGRAEGAEALPPHAVLWPQEA